jgi:hypothetical protein
VKRAVQRGIWTPRALSAEVKRMGREADHSFPSNAEVKNGVGIPPLPRMLSWRGALLIK